MEQLREKLLLVDDSNFQRTVIREMLQESFDLTEVASGEECLEIFKSDSAQYEMVLLDLVMPGIDGFEVLRRRRDMDNFRKIPVIVLTTSDSESFQKEAFELGADEYIVKPVDGKVALSRINNILGARRRIKALLHKQEQLKIMSEIDGMTKLFNKTTIERLLNKTLEEASDKLHALMVIDIDNFKAVNDIFGHNVGDHTIFVVAGVLSSTFSSVDYIGRIGGDEFVVMMRDIGYKDIALKKADKLVETIRVKENLTIPENISLSIGVAFSDADDHSYTNLFNKADKALYNAKKAGKGCFFEYGTSAVTAQESDANSHSRVIAALTSSRNVTSILEFVYGASASLQHVSSVDDIGRMFSDGKDVAAVYIDVSDSTDSGVKIWDELKNVKLTGDPKIIAICKEGSMEQIRCAANLDIVSDIMFAPISADILTRRISSLNILG